MTLDGLMFDTFALLPICGRNCEVKAYVCPRIFDVVIMRVVFKGGVFEFIGRKRTKNLMMLCELQQDWF